MKTIISALLVIAFARGCAIAAEKANTNQDAKAKVNQVNEEKSVKEWIRISRPSNK